LINQGREIEKRGIVTLFHRKNNLLPSKIILHETSKRTSLPVFLKILTTSSNLEEILQIN